MPVIADLRSIRHANAVRSNLESLGLYHSIPLPDGRILRGAMDLQFQRDRWNAYRLPASLAGKTLLDIGPWDGFFTFEAERLGATVTAIDYVDLDTFRELHRLMNSKAAYLRMDVLDLSPETTGVFDIVLCLGVLYHLKHPLLGLEKICSVTKDLCIIDTFVTDQPEPGDGYQASIPLMEFYERDELGGQLDNWYGPSVSAVVALARAAGFARVEVLEVSSSTARFACWRNWPSTPAGSGPPPLLHGLTSHRDRGKTFRSGREEYIQLWFELPESHPAPDLDTIFPTASGFGVPPLSCLPDGDSWQVSFRLPPGLPPGRHDVRLSTPWASLSEPCHFHLDLPPNPHPLTLVSVQDGVSWLPGSVDWQRGGWLTLWLTGLTVEADPGNTVIEISGVPHSPNLVDPATGQVNLRLRPAVRPGPQTLIARHRGAESNPLPVEVLGEPAPLHGFESLNNARS